MCIHVRSLHIVLTQSAHTFAVNWHRGILCLLGSLVSLMSVTDINALIPGDRHAWLIDPYFITFRTC